MPTSELNDLINANSQNLNQFKAFASIYEKLQGGIPNIAGFTSLITTNNETNFGSRTSSNPGPKFNPENIFINIANALFQGSPSASNKFNGLASGDTLSAKLTSVYNSLVVPSQQTDAGRSAFASQAEFYSARATELGIPGETGGAVVGFAALLNILVRDNNAGIGNSVSDLLAAIADGSAAATLPETSTALIPIEIADGTKFDSDDVASVIELPAGAVLFEGGPGEEFVVVQEFTKFTASGGEGTDTLIVGVVDLPTPATITVSSIEIITNLDSGSTIAFRDDAPGTTTGLDNLNTIVIGNDTTTYVNAKAESNAIVFVGDGPKVVYKWDGSWAGTEPLPDSIAPFVSVQAKNTGEYAFGELRVESNAGYETISGSDISGGTSSFLPTVNFKGAVAPTASNSLFQFDTEATTAEEAKTYAEFVFNDASLQETQYLTVQHPTTGASYVFYDDKNDGTADGMVSFLNLIDPNIDPSAGGPTEAALKGMYSAIDLTVGKIFPNVDPEQFVLFASGAFSGPVGPALGLLDILGIWNHPLEDAAKYTDEALDATADTWIGEVLIEGIGDAISSVGDFFSSLF